ncbi:MAG TPA: ATP-binding protein [Gemmatimonadaceae bacterium]|nr:ATP-binding protein [Gemmatimonadaceae bacterium]
MTRWGQRALDTPPLTQLRRGRLSRRLLAWLLLFSLVPLLATNAVGYGRTSVILRRFVERYLSAIAQTQAQHVHDRIERSTLMLEAIVAGNEFLAAGALRSLGRPAGQMGTVSDRASIEHLLQHKLEETVELDAIYLFTPEGRVVGAAGRADAIVTTPPATPNNSSVSATLVRSAAAARPLFRFVAPVRAGDGTVVAFLGATLSATGFRSLIELPPHLAGHIESFIVDERGRPLFVSHEHSDVDFTAPLASPLATRPGGVFERYADPQGEEVLATVAAVPGSRWRFIAELPTAEAFGDLQSLGRLSLILELLLVMVLGATAWFVARDIVAPLGRLVDATRRVGRGDLRVRVDIPQRDEIGELGRAFNEMTTALEDTTSRVRQLHQHEIQRASQLATVGELASGVAHEIKNPVVGVAHGLDLVRRHLGPDPALTPIMDEMARQLTRIQQTLQELLTFARPATPALAPVSGNDIVQRAIRLLQPTADRAGVRIEMWVDPALPRFDADEEMLYQALVNVFMNALQATPCGGRITVTTRSTTERVEIIIADTGRGIPEEDLELVFKPFFTTRHTGTGLGLSITREVAQRHGGGVTLESTVGVGTTVTLHLPLRHVEAAVGRAAEEVRVE